MPQTPADPTAPRTTRPTARTLVAVAGLVSLGVALAVSSLLQDSITFDEPFHLVAGVAALKDGDFRISAEHPPLARLWCALPVVLSSSLVWDPASLPGWVDMDFYTFGVAWLGRQRDPHMMVVSARLMMVALLVATWVAIWGIARRLGGEPAGLIALVLAVLSPTLLAHGRLVTTDLPVALGFLLTLWTTARLFERFSWLRLMMAGVVLGATAVTKMSWPLVLPAVVGMAIAAWWRKPTTGETSPSRRALTIVGGLAGMGLLTLGVIWSAYQWRLPMIPPLASGATAAEQARYDATLERLQYLWHFSIHHPDHTPREGLVPTFCRVASAIGVLPDAYVYGLAQASVTTGQRLAYLMGEYSTTGWASYFPVAFAIKTPLAAIALMLVGGVAIIRRWAASRDAVLLTGMVVFLVVYGANAIVSNLNIGHRHLLPLYPILYIVAGASAVYFATRLGRVVLGLAIAWLALANARVFPDYLAYFNETVGGPANGHLYLADSNLDWGQNLLRLQQYAAKRPSETVWLAYFGSAPPTLYLRCHALPSFYQFQPIPEVLSAGTYVVSATQLHAVYNERARASFWTEARRLGLAELIHRSAQPGPREDPATLAMVPDLRAELLLSRLAQRPPDERIGPSLFVYRLTDDDARQLSTP